MHKKVVQTELSDEEYQALAQTAKSYNLTIKQAAKEALTEWALSRSDFSEDPLFRIRPAKFKVKVRADRLDEYLYRHKEK
jgi:hypothetical protein